MKLEDEAKQDVPLDGEVAEHVTGGRKTTKFKSALSHATSSPVVAPTNVGPAPEANTPNTPLPISPFGDNCIPAEDATAPGSST